MRFIPRLAAFALAFFFSVSIVPADDAPPARPAPLGAYDARLAEADAAFAAAIEAAAADRQLQLDRADARFRDRIAAAAEAWRRSQQDANARTLSEFRKDIATVRRKGDLVMAEEIEAAQQAFIAASLEQSSAFDLGLAELVPSAATAPPTGDSVLVEARITGESALHITPHGLHWENISRHRKPDGVAVDGRPWPLQWHAPEKPTGPDTSTRLDLPLDPARTTVELVYATNGPRGTGGRRPNNVITTRFVDDTIIVSLADHAAPAGFYGLRIRGLRPQPTAPAPETTAAPEAPGDPAAAEASIDAVQ